MRRCLPLLITLLVGAWLQGCGTSQWERGGMTRFPAEPAIVPAARPAGPVAVSPPAPPTPPPRILPPNATAASVVDPSVTQPLAVMPLLPPGVTTLEPAPVPAVLTGNSAWLPLETWASGRGVGSLRRLSTNQFQLVTYSGVFSFAERNAYALWNNRRFHLGRPIQVVNGTPVVHALDAEKNLQPLVESFRAIPRGRGIICLDPGHGGKHTGTKSILEERHEKTYSLDWAARLKPLLEQRGWSVVLTRGSDETVSLEDRVAIADRYGADLFLSLHFNASSPSAAGLETYCATPTGMASTLNRGYSDPVNVTFPNNQFDAANLHLAARVHDSLLRNVGMADRGIRRARFMTVLVRQKRPAVLIEGGYLSDPAEARLIDTTQYRQRLAEAVAAAF